MGTTKPPPLHIFVSIGSTTTTLVCSKVSPIWVEKLIVLQADSWTFSDLILCLRLSSFLIVHNITSLPSNAWVTFDMLLISCSSGNYFSRCSCSIGSVETWLQLVAHMCSHFSMLHDTYCLDMLRNNAHLVLCGKDCMSILATTMCSIGVNREGLIFIYFSLSMFQEMANQR